MCLGSLLERGIFELSLDVIFTGREEARSSIKGVWRMAISPSLLCNRIKGEIIRYTKSTGGKLGRRGKVKL